MRTGAAGVSGLAALVLLVPMEAGVPIPLPADLVMFTVGARVAAGRFPLWLAVAGFEVIAVIGTTALFVACRGSGHRMVARYGPRIGLTEARVRRVAVVAETRGLAGLAVAGLEGVLPGREQHPGLGRDDLDRGDRDQHGDFPERPSRGL